ncbi:MAG: NAD(P)-binding domain-containing protein, partial [Candidatus Cybelea sp.]
MKIGVVGTGRMGANLARRLHDVGYRIVALYDVRPEPAAEVAAETGGEVSASLARVSELADVVVTVVSDDAAMYQIFAPHGDSLLNNAQGRVFLN